MNLFTRSFRPRLLSSIKIEYQELQSKALKNSLSSVKSINHYFFVGSTLEQQPRALASVIYFPKMVQTSGVCCLSFSWRCELRVSYPNREQQILSNDFIVPFKKKKEFLKYDTTASLQSTVAQWGVRILRYFFLYDFCSTVFRRLCRLLTTGILIFIVSI